MTIESETGFPSLICCIDGRERSGSASTTTDASVSMNDGSVPSVGTRTKVVIPACLAVEAYSRSISFSVPMCSKTNEIGTTTSVRTPSAPSWPITSDVDGPSHATRCGPNCPWKLSVFLGAWPSSASWAVTSSTVRRTCSS